MHIHIQGICGTFMAGLALIARQLGHKVSGSDVDTYPPMSTVLQNANIEIKEGYSPQHLQPRPDLVVVGNVISRGNEQIEFILNQAIPYISGPQWLAEQVLRKRHVIACAGTHGKTTTASMTAWILEYAGLSPGFLIGGVSQHFADSARLGRTPYFVIEADEYDTAFFDKRSKFVHYQPRTLILNNLEFDHADIFDSLDDIKRQCHHLIRTIPGNGLIIVPAQDRNIQNVLQQGCWSKVSTIGDQNWHTTNLNDDGSAFSVLQGNQNVGEISWSLMGEHNQNNALAAMVAAQHCNVSVQTAIEALNGFKGVKRRMEVRGQIGPYTFYDDFAHHPTAITTTLKALRARVKAQNIVVLFELGSNTMRMGIHQHQLAQCFSLADKTHMLRPQGLSWDIDQMVNQAESNICLHQSVEAMLMAVCQQLLHNTDAFVSGGIHVVVMSNGSFGHILENLFIRTGVMYKAMAQHTEHKDSYRVNK